MPERRPVRGPLVGSLVLVLSLAALAGCSKSETDGGAAPSSTVAAFCGGLQAFETQVEAADETDLAAYVATLKAAAEALVEVGVPDDMPGAARHGFELTVSRIRALADDASEEDVAGLGDVSEEEQRRLDAMNTYIEDACPEFSEDGS